MCFNGKDNMIIKRKLWWIYLLILFCFLFGQNLQSQQMAPLSANERIFEESLNYFQGKDYAMAQASLQRYEIKDKFSLRAEDKVYMLACCSYELGDVQRYKYLQQFLIEYPSSLYADRVRALMASVLFFDKKFTGTTAIDCAAVAFEQINLSNLLPTDREDMLYRAGVSELKSEKADKYQKAEQYFTELKNANGGYQEDAVYYLSYLDYHKKLYQQAANGFEVIKNDRHYGELSYFYLADCQLKLKHYDRVEQLANEFFNKYPVVDETNEMKRILGESYYQTGRYVDAANALQEYVQLTANPDRNVLDELAMSYYQSKVYSKAITVWDRVTTIEDALSQSAFYHSGLAYLQMFDKNNARMAFEQAAHLNFDKQIREEASYNYAVAVWETSYSAFGQSVTAFENFLNEFPNSVYADRISEYLVEIYMTTKSYQTALASINRIKKPGKQIFTAKQNILFQLGTEAFANSKFDEARQYFEQSLELSAYNQQLKADAYYWLGETNYREKNYQKAEKQYRQYLLFTIQKNNEMYALAYYNLGYIAFNDKQYTQSRAFFEQFVKNEKSDNKIALADAYNRLGDCYFQNREFATATDYYDRAMHTDTSVADYALYQMAFTAGLEKDYKKKIALLNSLIQKYHSSDYLDESIYEKGRAYVIMGQNEEAIATYNQLVAQYPNSVQARKGASEMALLYYQSNQNDEAIKTYKEVIKKYPGSDEANSAMRDLRSVYVDESKVDDYFNFMKEMRGGVSLSVAEQDSVTFAAAEKNFMHGQTDQAQKDLEAYLKNYPQGAFNLDAHYYLCSILAGKNDLNGALIHAEAVLAQPEGQYTQETRQLYAGLLMTLKQYKKADEAYRKLALESTDPDDLASARENWLKSANLAGDNVGVIDVVTTLLLNKKIAPEMKNEALYCRAKAYSNQKETEKALLDYQVLAKDTRNVYGAEAKYQIAQIYYNEGEMSKAEKLILQYIDESTPHLYWLARSFVLLSDVYVKLNRKADAKQYLLSLQQNYTTKDDIQMMINSRLEKLK
jgi:TolA-binding protein